MRWRVLLAVFGLSVSCVASFAQRPPGDQPPAAAGSTSHANGFFETTGMVQFELIQGRLCLNSLQHRKGSQQREEAGQYENVTVTAERGIPSLHYVFESKHQHITISVQQATSLLIESWLVESDERCSLVQPTEGPVKFSIRRGDLHDQYAGATLIHVRHADIAGFDRHFGLLIQRMLRGVSLEKISQATELVVFDQIQNASWPDIEAVRQQVDGLRSPQRAIRMLSEKQLLAWGTPIVPVLRSIPDYELDAEQMARVHSIAQQLRPRVGDTPASLAKLLANDRSYWTAVCSRLSSDQLQIANRHFQRMGALPIALENKPVQRIAAARE